LFSEVSTLYGETDPLIGLKTTMTIHEQPLCRIVDVNTSARSAAEDHFFLTSLSGSRYLGAL
jgi:hypothetical protein